MLKIQRAEKSISVQIVQYVQENSRPTFSKSIYDWQYANHKSPLCYISDNNSVLGTQGMIFTELLTNNKRILSHKSETTFVSNELRGTGSFEKLYSSAVDEATSIGSQLIWGFTALGKVWETKLGFQYHPSLIQEARLIVNDYKIKGIKRKAFYVLCKTKLTLKLLFSPKNGYSISEIHKPDNLNFYTDYADFYSNNSIHIDHFSESANNRILRSPLIHYRFLEVKLNAEETIAHIISHVQENVMYITDIVYKTNADVRKVIQVLIQFLKDQKNVNVINFWGNGQNKMYNEVFTNFIHFGAKVEIVHNMQLVYKILDSSLTDINLQDYYINGLWSEGFTY